MAFKSVQEVNADRYKGMFLLEDDGDFKDVIILYRSEKDALFADTHYIKSPDYNGYVHCLEHGCPACKKGIRIQNKYFIPLYVVDEDRVLFWDRFPNFHSLVMDKDVFSKYPNPSEFVFRITRNGERGDINTRYSIVAVGRNADKPYDAIMESMGISLPEYYDTICANWSASDYQNHLVDNASSEAVSGDKLPEYKLTPRGVEPAAPEVPEISDEMEENRPKF